MIYSVYYANCENWCNEKIRHENDNCIVAYTYLKTNKCQKNLLALYEHILGMSDARRNGQPIPSTHGKLNSGYVKW